MKKKPEQDISNFDILKQLVTPETGGDVLLITFFKEALFRAKIVVLSRYGEMGDFTGTPLESEINDFYKSMTLGSLMHLLTELGIDLKDINDHDGFFLNDN